MPYAFTQDVPIDGAMYAVIRQGLGDEPPAGLISHTVVELEQGGLRYIDVWESERDWQAFVEVRLHPVVHAMLREIFGDDLPPEPEQSMMNVIDVWLGAN
jgi:hypothetical protein